MISLKLRSAYFSSYWIAVMPEILLSAKFSLDAIVFEK